MTVGNRLDATRHEIPGCSLACFGDLQTGLCLRVSADSAHRQDFLEFILRQAGQSFAAADAMAGTTRHRAPRANRVMLATPDHVRIAIRSPCNDADVVCCLCDDPAMADHVDKAAQELFEEIRGGM